MQILAQETSSTLYDRVGICFDFGGFTAQQHNTDHIAPEIQLKVLHYIDNWSRMLHVLV